MNAYGILFGARNLNKGEIEGKRVIEVGAYDVNGSLRPLIESYSPREYVGVDISEGPGVDVVCDVNDLLSRFGEQNFDVVISTELLEHVRDWKTCIHNIKGVCKQNGIILITTRSYGCAYHGYPYDFWRYEVEDIRTIFGDCVVKNIEKDPENGVFVKLLKPDSFVEKDLVNHELYSIVTDKRIQEMRDDYLSSFYFRRLVFKERLRHYLYRKVNAILSKV